MPYILVNDNGDELEVELSDWDNVLDLLRKFHGPLPRPGARRLTDDEAERLADALESYLPKIPNHRPPFEWDATLEWFAGEEKQTLWDIIVMGRKGGFSLY